MIFSGDSSMQDKEERRWGGGVGGRSCQSDIQRNQLIDNKYFLFIYPPVAILQYDEHRFMLYHRCEIRIESDVVCLR